VSFYHTNLGPGTVSVLYFKGRRDGAYYPFFTGRIEAMPEQAPDLADAFVDVALVEVTADLARVNDAALTVGVGGGETVEERAQRLLDAAEFFSGLDLSIPTYLASTIAHNTTLSGNRLDELQILAASVAGRILATGAGALMLTGLTSGQTLADLGARDYHFTNNPAPGGTPYPLVEARPYADNARLLNKVQASNDGGTITKTVQDRASIAKFGVISEGFGFPRTDLVGEGTVTVDVIRAALAAHAWDEIGLSGFDLDADQDVGLYYALTLLASLGLEYRVELAITWKHPSGQVFTETVLLDGFTMNLIPMGPAAKWTASLEVSNANPVRG